MSTIFKNSAKKIRLDNECMAGAYQNGDGDTNGLDHYSDDHENIMEIQENDDHQQYLSSQSQMDDEPSGSPQSYSCVDLKALESSLDHNLLCDFFAILREGTSKGLVLPDNILSAALNSSVKSWKHIDCIKELYVILSIELKSRSLNSPSYSLIKPLLVQTIDELKTMMLDDDVLHHLDGCSDFISLQLRLHYIVEVLNHQRIVDVNHQLVELLLSRHLLKHIVSLLVKISTYMTQRRSETTISFSITQLYDDLHIISSLPTRNADLNSKVDEIVHLFVEELNHIHNTDIKKSLLLSISSNSLLEKVIDLHLEKEFSLHPSAVNFINTSMYQGSASSLSKFCCVHLCRMPFKLNGGLNAPDYMLFLLCTLLRLLILHDTSVFLKNPSNFDTYRSILNSVKSHVPVFIDRLMEDESIMELVVQPECWSYLQLLGNMTDLLEILK
jgi:hypothetical protein